MEPKFTLPFDIYKLVEPKSIQDHQDLILEALKELKDALELLDQFYGKEQ